MDQLELKLPHWAIYSWYRSHCCSTLTIRAKSQIFDASYFSNLLSKICQYPGLSKWPFHIKPLPEKYWLLQFWVSYSNQNSVFVKDSCLILLWKVNISCSNMSGMLSVEPESGICKMQIDEQKCEKTKLKLRSRLLKYWKYWLNPN